MNKQIKNNSNWGPVPSTGFFELGTSPQATRAFTLVELIVVITILAILGTIAFISLQGYSASSRDSVRISDVSNMKTSLELFQLNAGKYPIPTDGIEITYSGSEAWTQGTFGELTFKNVEKLDKIPLDPLTDKKYTYSTTNTRQEFQIAGILEGDLVFNSELLDKSYAGDKTAILKVFGNYNGKLLKVSKGSTNYVLAIPSLITSSGTTIENIVANNLLAYNGYKNLPVSYEGSKYNTLGDIGILLVNNTDFVVYEGDIKILSDATQIGKNARIALIQSLQNAYTGTIINEGGIQSILLTDLSDLDAVELLSSTIITNNLGGNIIPSSDVPVIPSVKTYATFNPLDKATGINLSNEDLTVTAAGVTWVAIRSNTGKNTGKWYWEIKVDSGGFMNAGIGDSIFDVGTILGANSKSLGINLSVLNGGYGNVNGITSTFYNGITFVTGDIASYLLDMDNKELYMMKNGVYVNDGLPVATGLSGDIFPAFSIYGSNYGGYAPGIITVNFGQNSFYFTVPSGYNAGFYN